jgi:hypothetical protein
MKKNITQMSEFEEFIERFDFFKHAQVDEDNIKSDSNILEINLLCPLDDSPENREVYEKFLFFTLEKHAYISVNLKFNNVKNSEIILNRDEHDEAIYIQSTVIDLDEKAIRFVFEHDNIKHIKVEYTDFSVELSLDDNEKTYAHKRLKFRPIEALKDLLS